MRSLPNEPLSSCQSQHSPHSCPTSRQNQRSDDDHKPEEMSGYRPFLGMLTSSIDTDCDTEPESSSYLVASTTMSYVV